MCQSRRLRFACTSVVIETLSIRYLKRPLRPGKQSFVFVAVSAVRVGPADWADGLEFAAIVIVVESFLSLLIGLPVHLLFRFIGWNKFWMYAAGGACIGLLGEYLWGLMQIDGVVSGAIGALVYWLLAGRAPIPDSARQA